MDMRGWEEENGRIEKEEEAPRFLKHLRRATLFKTSRIMIMIRQGELHL